MRRFFGKTVFAVGFLVAWTQPAFAAAPPFRTVIDSLAPPQPGLTITGMPGGCDLLIDNETGQELLLFDQSNPPQPLHFPAPPKGSPPKPLTVHLQGKWPCASLPTVTEEQRWNHTSMTVLAWAAQGQVGQVGFQLRARTLYDPTLDTISELMLYLRIGGGMLALAGLVVGLPFLLVRRHQIFSAS